MGNYRDRSKWRFDGTIRAAFLREFIGPPLIGGSIDGNPMLTFMASNATITPAITLSGDGPCQWEVTEANGAKYYYSANSFSHTRSVAGNMTVRLLNTMQVAPFVLIIEIQGDGVISYIETLSLPIFANLQSLFANVNPNQLLGAGNTITLPITLRFLELQNNGLYSCPKIATNGAIRLYQIQDNDMPSTEINAFVNDVYSKRASLTYATPTFNIGGTNADPSGIYQNPSPNPPATPLEMIYVLVNDPFVEGFNKQVWTY